jgi:ubiquinone/menaquinone biosynthesis C-methylase UbiE
MANKIIDANNNKLVLDLCPGEIPYKAKPNEKVITLDFNPKFRPDVLHDLRKLPTPFPKNKFDKIYASHIIEHIPDTVAIMNELYRILKPSGVLILRTPHFSSRGAWINPTHYKAFSIFTFDYFNKSIAQPYGNCNFKVIKREFHYLRPDVQHSKFNSLMNRTISFFANTYQDLCERVWCYWVGGFSEIYIQLKAIK